MLLFVIAVMVLGNLAFFYFRESMRRDHMRFVGAVLEEIADVYPQVPEEELIALLDAEQPSDRGLSLLARYGIFEEVGSRGFGGQEKSFRTAQTVGNLFLLGVLGAAVGGALRYLWKRQQKIAELQTYMERLDRGEYRLELEDNGDDELSGLRNEIYRLTVFMREQAVQAQERRKALADSVANISHQLKTPLTSMTILADNLAEAEDMSAETRQHFLSEIIRQLTGMSWLIAAMLKLSRLEAGVVELERGESRVKTLIEHCVQNLEMIAEWKRVHVRTTLPENVFLTVDFDWTAEAVGNIVKNAIEHSPEGGVVDISASENDIYTEIKITDNGVGISAEEREKLFQRFYRGNAPTADSAGIGLALSKEVIEMQNGQIAVESREGQGTVFSIKFMK